MNAILVNSLAGGGAERVALSLLSEMKAKGHEVQLICIEKEKVYDVPEGIKVHYLTNFIKVYNPFIKVFWVIVCARYLARYIRLQNISYVQSHLIRSNLINTAAKLFGSQHKAQIVSHLPIRKSAFGLKSIRNRIYSWLYSKADQVVSISEIMRNEMNQALGWKDGQVNHVVIHNPHDLKMIKTKAKEKPKDFIIKQDIQYIISIGRQLKHKRVEITIKALAEVRKSKTNVELLILGEGEDKAFFKQISKTLGLQDYVHFLGHCPNPFAFLGLADIFVLSSEMEGLPNIIIEALVCGTPVISSDCVSGPREILSPNSNYNTKLTDKFEIAEYGILYPVERHDLLAKAIILLLENEQLRRSFCQIEPSYLKTFDKKNIIEKYLEIFTPPDQLIVLPQKITV